MRDWIARPAAAPRPAGEASTAAPPPAALGPYLADRLTAVRARMRTLVAAAPDVPEELAHAWLILSLEFEEQGLLGILLLIAAFASLGFGAQRLFWHLTGGWRRRVTGASLATVRERLSVVFQRLLYGILNIAAAGLGSVGAFLAFSWPPLLQEIVLAGLLVFLVIMTAHALGRFALAPTGPRFRVLAVSQASAEHWFFWLRVLAGYVTLQLVVLDLLRTLGVGEAERDLLRLVLGSAGLGLGLAALFRRPPPTASGCRGPGPAAGCSWPRSRSPCWPVRSAPTGSTSCCSSPWACRWP